MWNFALAENILVLSSTWVLIYAAGPETASGLCDDDGVCLKPAVETLDVDYVSSKVLEFKNEAVTKSVAVLQALGFTRAEEDDRHTRVFGFGWAAKKALNILNLFGFSGGQLSNIDVVPVNQNIIPIPTCNMSNYEPCRGGTGICTSPSSCARRGGNSIGRCGKCVGCTTCCQYSLSCRESTEEYISYFQSPSYPKSDRTNDACSLTVNIREDVGQVRLDFLDFEMPHPLGGVCADRLQIMNTAQPGGVFGPGNNALCGLNTGQHIYLPVTPGSLLMLRAITSGVLHVPLASVSGRSRGLSGDTQFRWNVKITQIPTRRKFSSSERSMASLRFAGAVASNSVKAFKPLVPELHCEMSLPKYFQDLAAPEGCDQYHMKSRGEITSFNYDGRSEINLNYDYTICVKRPVDTCGMTMRAVSFSLPATAPCLIGNINVDDVAGALCCTVAAPPDPNGIAAGVNYFGFPAFSDGTIQSALVPNAGRFNNGQNQYSSVPWLQRYYFCGQSLGNPDTNLVVARVKGPLIVKVKTADAYWGPNQFAVTPVSPFCPTGGCVGFKIMYDVDTGSC